MPTGRGSRSVVLFWCSFLAEHLHVIRLLVLGNCAGHQAARVRSLLCLLLSGPPFLQLAKPQDLPNFWRCLQV